MHRVEYQLTREDYRAYLEDTARAWWDYSLGWAVGGTIVIGAGFGLVESIYGFKFDSYLFTALLFALLVVMGALAAKVSRMRKLRRWVAPEGPTIIEADETQIVKIENGATRAIAWDRVGLLEYRGTRIEVGSTPDEEIYFIPAHAFADGAAMREFFLYCEAQSKEKEANEDDLWDNPFAENDGEVPLPEQPRSVTCSIEPEDWASVNADLNRGNYRLSYVQSALLSMLTGGVITGGLAGMLSQYTDYPFGFVTFFAFAFPGALILTVLAAHFYDKVQARTLNTLSERNRNYTLTIDAQGLTRKADGLEVHYAWKVVPRGELKGESILFGMAWNEHVIAPKRAFAKDEDYWLFLQEAATWQRAARKQETIKKEDPEA